MIYDLLRIMQIFSKSFFFNITIMFSPHFRFLQINVLSVVLNFSLYLIAYLPVDKICYFGTLNIYLYPMLYIFSIDKIFLLISNAVTSLFYILYYLSFSCDGILLFLFALIFSSSLFVSS